jgi:hypothetical protein
VEFQDGCIQEYLENTIAEIIHALIDTEGNEYVILWKICDHCNDGLAAIRDDMFIEQNQSGLNAQYR